MSVPEQCREGEEAAEGFGKCALGRFPMFECS
jgi:hypothetical protein